MLVVEALEEKSVYGELELVGGRLDYLLSGAAALNRGNEFLTTLILVHRGYALLLQGKKDEAERDFDKCRQLTSGKQIDLRVIMSGIEAQIKERRRRRDESLKGITE